MSLNDALSVEAATRLSDVTSEDLLVLVKALSLGLTPTELHAAITRVANGEVVALSAKLGAPRPLTINAWSWASDPGQYKDTYGVTDSEAGRLRGLLRDAAEEGIAEITKIVTDTLRQRGSNKPVRVSREGLPGAGPGDHKSAPSGKAGDDLKAEIAKSPSIYGMYSFEATDTGRPGPYRFRVRLGSGLYAVFQSKRGAIDVARICRVKGRFDESIAGRVVFWREGRAPLAGPDIPAKIRFDGRLKPGEEAPVDPVEKEGTVAGN